MTNIKSALFAILAVCFLASCANESASTEASNAALTETANAVTPNANAANDVAAKPAEAAAPVGPTTTLEWAETEFDFGTIDQGEAVEHSFSFTNTGSEPLIISNAKGSCGCTVPQWPREPIAPGATANIDVRFDSKGKRNKQNKKVTITANTDPAQSFIFLKGEVNAPEADPAKPATN
jgi:hypothetical protein